MMRRLCWALALVMLTAALAMTHEDLEWIRPFTGVDGISCCNPSRDCAAADVWVWNLQEGDVEINGARLSLPVQMLHRIPHDVGLPLTIDGIVCYRSELRQTTRADIRCVFYRSGYL